MKKKICQTMFDDERLPDFNDLRAGNKFKCTNAPSMIIKMKPMRLCSECYKHFQVSTKTMRLLRVKQYLYVKKI